MNMYFTKMQGCGNDFIFLNDLDEKYKDINSKAQILCNRNFKIGADGIILVRKSDKADVKMVLINSDGSYANMCGNGIRCFAKYVWEKDIVKKPQIDIETGDGIKKAVLNIENNKVKEVTINMGIPSFEPHKIPVLSDKEVLNKTISVNNIEYKINSVLMGVPHTIIFEDKKDYDVTCGKYIEKYDIFPEGTNVDFVKILSRKEINVKTWERGAGSTMACGTGCSASVAIGNKLGLLDNEVSVNVKGGILKIKIVDNNIYMTGKAEISFEGVCEI